MTMNIESFLQQLHVRFETRPHRSEYTASRTAQALHVPGAHFAKTVVLKVDGRPVLAVLPATRHVRLDNVKQVLAAHDVALAAEREFPQLFPDCELGAVPPFGSQYGMDTIVDKSLSEDDEFVFEGNTRDCAVSMRYDDYATIEQPRVAAITGA
jgi:Ala-tRNA(Pro) deacylase